MIEGHGDDIYYYGALRCNFSSNISPLIDTSELRKHLAERLEVINHYPEPSAHSLEVLLANEYHIQPDEVLVTNGATDAIYLIAQTLRNERTFAVKRPTFSEYADACRMYGYEEAPKGGAVRWLCNPNNPTGELRTTDTVKVLSRCHHWLIIDQSYEDYTWAPLLSAKTAIDMQNVIVIHSMTKRFAIPGLRLGYIIAPSAVIDRLRANYRPWAVNALAIEAGHWLLEDEGEHHSSEGEHHSSEGEHHSSEEPCFREKMELLLAQTRYLRERLCNIFGIHVYPTSTNFMLCSIQQSTAAELKEYLLTNHGFLIRDATNFEGLKDCHFRIATQLPEFNDELVEAIKTFVYKVKRNA
jgi:threonine-phosphate decarboxylase